MLGWKIRGIRTVRTSNQPPYKDDNLRWIKIKGFEFRIGRYELKELMEKLGTLVLDRTEDRVNISSDEEGISDNHEDSLSVRTSTYSVKSRLHSDLRQLISKYNSVL
jgi:hypothetical protein